MRPSILRRCVYLAVLLAPALPLACSSSDPPPPPPADAGVDSGNDSGAHDSGANDAGHDSGDDSHDAGHDSGDDSSDAGNDAPSDANVVTDAPSSDGDTDAADGGGKSAQVIVTGVAADSIVVDGTNVYWRASALDEAGDSFSVAVGKCALGGGCPSGGDVLGTTSAGLVFSGEHQVALAAGKVIVPAGDSLLACATGGCGGVLTPITTQSGNFTSITAVGTKLYFGLTGPVGSRYLESCDVASCATPTVLGATSGAPADPSIGGQTIAFSAAGVYTTPTSGFPDGGATSLATFPGYLGIGLSNDGTDVYISMGGQFSTDDAGDSTIANDTGFVARCALSGCGGKPHMIVSGESNVGGVATDGNDVYWPVSGPEDSQGAPTGPGRIEACSKTDGCATVKTIVSGGHPSTLAVDANYLYFADPVAQTIAKIARH